MPSERLIHAETTSPGHLIAKKSFDTGELFKLYEDRAFQLNEAARLEVIEGLTFVATPRGVLARACARRGQSS